MEGLASEAGKAFLTQGILGALTVILFGAVVFLYRERRISDDRRIEELTKIIEARETLSKALNSNAMALEANNRAIEARTRTTEEMAREIAEMRRSLESAMQQGGFHDSRVQERLNEIFKRLDDLCRNLPPRGSA